MSPEPAFRRPGEPRQAATPGQETSAAELAALTTEVNQVRPLEPGEQPRLVDRLRDSDEQAVARLLETHLGMVLDLARSRRGRGLSVGDLFQEGSVGLLASIRAFPAAGADDFDRFTAAQVALAMEDALAAEAEEVRQEQLLIQALADYDRVEIALAGELKRVPTLAEIATKLEWTLDRAAQVRDLVVEARRRHDEEIALYIEADAGEDVPGEEEFGLN